MSAESEVVQLIEDRAGTGQADHATVYADGFNTIMDGIGAGVLARKGKVYYTDIPEPLDAGGPEPRRQGDRAHFA